MIICFICLNVKKKKKKVIFNIQTLICVRLLTSWDKKVLNVVVKYKLKT